MRFVPVGTFPFFKNTDAHRRPAEGGERLQMQRDCGMIRTVIFRPIESEAENQMNTKEPIRENKRQEPVGIIGAMEKEIELLKNSMQILDTETVTGMTFYRGTLSGCPAVLVKCGVGKVNAGICAQTLIIRYGVKTVLFTGVAGSLRSEIGIGNIVVSTDAVQYDMDLTALGYPKGKFFENAISEFVADPELRRRVCASAAVAAPQQKVFEGRICSGDKFVADKETKQELAEVFGGLCCEMEGAAVGHVCTLNEVPFVIIRAISDNADDSSHMSFPEFLETSARNSAAIVCHMLQGKTES